MEARVGIERSMLCFLEKKSQETGGSQGYSAKTRNYSATTIHYPITEEFTESDMRLLEQLFVMDTS
jgi:hypothetical protein